MIHTFDRLNFTGIGLDVPVESLSNGRTYRKQVAYVGSFGHYDQTTAEPRQKVDITREDIDHWAQSIKRQIADGIGVTIQDTHEDTSDPNVSYGNIIDAATGDDSKGRYSLFLICEFANEEEASRLSKVADVSIYQPPRFVSGTGTVYARPIRHLMLTTKPVVPGLDKFVALSIIQPVKGPTKMLRPLAKRIGLTFADDITDEALSELIAGEFARVVSLAKPVEQSVKPPKAAVTLYNQLRVARLDALVQGEHITPACKTALAKAFESNQTIALSADGDTITDDVFEGVCVALSALPKLGIAGRTMPNIGDPTPIKDAEVDLVALMKAKAEAAKAAKA